MLLTFVIHKPEKRKSQHTKFGRERRGQRLMYLLSIVEGKKKNAKPVFFHRQPPSGQEWMRLYIKSNLLGIKSKNWPDKKY